jgi:DNA polymerase III gamma/tau subunit
MDISNMKITDGPKLVRRGPTEGASLYSAYRPLRFSELYGSAKIAGDGIKREITINNGKLSHPGLAFTGDSGTGKTTLALITSLVLNCQNLQEDDEENKTEACLECPRCKSIISKSFDGTDPYYIVKNTAQMKNDDIISMVENEIKSGTSIIGRRGGTRVICLEEAHNLTKKSIENLLLPVENVLNDVRKARVHVMLTSSEHATLFTNKAWQSRILSIKLRAWSPQDLFNILVDINKNEHSLMQRPKVSRSVLSEIIDSSDLSLRRAIALLQGILEQSTSTDGVINIDDTGLLLDNVEKASVIEDFVEALVARKESYCYKFLADSYFKRSANFETIATQVVKQLTQKGIAYMAKGYKNGHTYLEMASIFNKTLGNSLYQDRFSVVALAVYNSLQTKFIRKHDLS